RPGQTYQARHRLSDDDRTQFRRSVARDRLAAADGEAQGLDAGELAAWRRRDHRGFRVRRGREKDLSEGLEVAEAVSADRSSAGVVTLRVGLVGFGFVGKHVDVMAILAVSVLVLADIV